MVLFVSRLGAQSANQGTLKGSRLPLLLLMGAFLAAMMLGRTLEDVMLLS